MEFLEKMEKTEKIEIMEEDPTTKQCATYLKLKRNMMPIKTLDIIFRRRRVANSQYYFTTRRHAVEETKQKQHRHFRMPRSDKLLAYIRHNDKKEKILQKCRLNQSVQIKDNIRFAATRDISKRLYVEEPLDDVRAVVEIHPDFYRVVEGRPIKLKDDIKIYISNIRNFAMIRQQIGYRHDMVLSIEKNIADESRDHDELVKKIKLHIHNFQKYLTEDYKLAQAKVAMSEKIVESLNNMNSIRLVYTSSMTMMNNNIFKLDSIRNVYKIYRQYLLFVAPLSWRQQYDESLKHRSESLHFDSGEFVTDNDLVDYLDIDRTIELAKVELRHPLPPNMYFKQPEEMKNLFRLMELQSREYLIQLSKTDVPIRMLREGTKQLKNAAEHESEYFQYYIDYFKNAINRELQNEQFLKDKFFRILQDTFFTYVASAETLKLKNCVEYVYQQIFDNCEEMYETLYEPMRILEVKYEQYNRNLDSLDFQVVNEARDDYFAQDLKLMLNAYTAQRELKSFREMTASVKRAFLPPAKFKRPELKKFINKKAQNILDHAERRKVKISNSERLKRKIRKITPEEREGLVLFTNWTEGTDPEPFLKDYYTHVKPVFDQVFKPKSGQSIRSLSFRTLT